MCEDTAAGAGRVASGRRDAPWEWIRRRGAGTEDNDSHNEAVDVREMTEREMERARGEEEGDSGGMACPSPILRCFNYGAEVQPGFGQTVAQITETMSLKSSHAMQSYGEVTADGKGSIPPIVLRILCAMSNADTGYSRPG
eukprot:2431844-Rhodomonas_salina.1